MISVDLHVCMTHILDLLFLLFLFDFVVYIISTHYFTLGIYV